jgi:predicted membrane protein
MTKKPKNKKVNHKNIIDFCYNVNEEKQDLAKTNNLMIKRIDIQSVPVNFDSENILYGISSC